MRVRLPLCVSMVWMHCLGQLTSPLLANETRLQRTQAPILYGLIDRKGHGDNVPAVELKNQPSLMDQSVLKAFQTSATQSLAGSAKSFSTSAAKGSASQPQVQKAVADRHQLNAELSDADLHNIATHDVVLLIDRSSSMRRTDCPPLSTAGSGAFGGWMGVSSRWEWCAANVQDLSEQLAKVSPDGVTLVLFSKERMVFNNVNPKAIPQIFIQAGTSSGTNLVGALAEQLNEHIARRRMTGTNKPLMVAVLTDGLPSDFAALVMQLVHLSGTMSNPNEIKITFLQVGNSPTGSILLRSLDDGLVKLGAKYDYVDSKSFFEVQRRGLGGSLLDAIKEK